MDNNKRLLSLLMAVLGSVSSSMAAKKRPSGGSARATQGRRLNNGRQGSNGGRKPVVKMPGHRKSVKKQVVLNDGGTERSNKKWSNEKIAVAVGAPLGLGAVGGVIGAGTRGWYYSDSQIRKRNLEKNKKFKNSLNVLSTSFGLLPAYEMKCDTSGKGNLKTRPFVWLKKGDDEWYVLMRKDNKTVKGALKGLGNLFQKGKGSSSGGDTTSSGPQYNAKVVDESISFDVFKLTADKMGQMSTENIVNQVMKGRKSRKIRERIEYELGGPEEEKKEQIDLIRGI